MNKKKYIEPQECIVDLGVRNGVAVDGGADSISKGGVGGAWTREERDWDSEPTLQVSTNNPWKEW